MTRSARWLFALALLGIGLSWAAAETKTDETKLSKDEQRILDLTNEARAKESVAPLKVNATLLKVARAHAANMARQRKMEHVLDDKNPARRVQDAGYDYRSVAENIGAADKGATVAAAFKGWMDSKPHRENLLNPKYEEIGLGIATDDRGRTYYAQVFGTQRRK